MRRLILLLLLSRLAALNAYSTMVVWDPGNAAQNAANETVNLAKWVKTELDTAATELNTLHTYENTIAQLARMGDPAQLRSLPGISDVAALYNSGQQLMYEYQSWQRYLSPQNFQYDMNSILSSYRLPTWQGFTSQSGVLVTPLPANYQFNTARWHIANSAQQQLAQLERQRQKLETQRDQALASLQAATTDSEVQKYHAIVNGLNGALADVSARANEMAHQVALKGQQIAAGEQIYKAAQAERTAADAYRAIHSDLSSLPADNFRLGAMWPQQ
jgi:hypothetical protein